MRIERTPRRRLAAIALACALAAAPTPRADAAAIVWTGAASAGAIWDARYSGGWGTLFGDSDYYPNWDLRRLPTSSDIAFFGQGFGSGSTVNLNGDRSLQGLTIFSLDAFNLAGGTLTLGSGGLDRFNLGLPSQGSQNIGANIVQSDSSTWDIGGAGSVTLSGTFACAAGAIWTKAGGGTLQVNNYAAGGFAAQSANVAGGILRTVGPVGSAQVVRLDGGNITFLNAFSAAQNYEVNADGTIDTGTFTATLSGTFTVAAQKTFTKAGAGTLRLSTAGTGPWNGSLRVAGGTLELDSATQHAVAANGAVTVDAGATLRLLRPDQLANTLAAQVAGTLDLASATEQVDRLTFTASGARVTGTAASSLSLSQIGTAVSVNAGVNATLAAPVALRDLGVGSQTAAFDVATGATLTVTGPLSGRLRKTGPGLLVLAAPNPSLGDRVLVDGGTVRVEDPQALAGLGSFGAEFAAGTVLELKTSADLPNLYLAADTKLLSATGLPTLVRCTNPSAITTIDGRVDDEGAGPISIESRSIYFTGTAAHRISGTIKSESASGLILMNVPGGSSANPAVARGTVEVRGGAELQLRADHQLGRSTRLEVYGGSFASAVASDAVYNDVRSLRLDYADIDGPAGAAIGLFGTAPGDGITSPANAKTSTVSVRLVLTPAGSNTVARPVDVGDNTYLYLYDVADGPAGPGSIRKLGGGRLVLPGSASYTGGLRIDAGSVTGNADTIRGKVDNNGLLEFNQPGAATFPGNISGAGQLVKSGAGTLTLTGGLTYTGLTTLQSGSLVVTANPLAGNVSIPSGFATLVFDLTGATAYPGQISGFGRFTKRGVGSLRLDAPSTYTGPTTLEAGTLVANADHALPAGTLLTVGGPSAAAAQLLLNAGHPQTLAGIVSAGTNPTRKIHSPLTPVTLTLNVSGTRSFDGEISGQIDLVKTGAGQQSVGKLAVRSLTVATGTLRLLPGGNAHATGALTLTGPGSLDLTNNSLVVTYGANPAPDALALLAPAYAAGRWTGPGLTSSTAAADPTRATAVGYADAPGQLTFRYTWLGDANLDGNLDAADAQILTSTSATQTVGWADGDFNYDGKRSPDDYALFALASATAAGRNISTLIPEPATLLPASALALMCRRRRHTHPRLFADRAP